MKIKINEKIKKTLADVPIGDLFVLKNNSEVYLKSRYAYQGAFKCHSARTGDEFLLASNTPVKIVKSVSIELEE